MSKISAVVLTYNKAWILPTFLASLNSQTRMPDQVIFVDDASTDNTRKMIGHMKQGWKKVFLPHNIGQSRARNKGFEHVSGDLVIFLDGDIEMRSDMLHMMESTLAANHNDSFAYCPYARTGTRTGVVKSCPWNPKKLMSYNFVSTMAMVRKDHLPSPPFDPNLSRYEDWDLWIRMAKRGRRGAFINQVLFTAHYKKSDLSGVGESKPWYEKVRKKHNLTV